MQGGNARNNFSCTRIAMMMTKFLVMMLMAMVMDMVLVMIMMMIANQIYLFDQFTIKARRTNTERDT